MDTNNNDIIQTEEVLIERPDYQYGLGDQQLDTGVGVRRPGFGVVEFRTASGNGDYTLKLPFHTINLQYVFTERTTGGSLGTGFYNRGIQGCTIRYISSGNSVAYNGFGSIAVGGSGTKISITKIEKGVMYYTVSDYTSTFRGFVYCY